MFLTAQELKDLTGRIYAKSQIKWLNERGYPFELDARGRPKVLKNFVELKMGIPARKIKKSSEPNFDALRAQYG